MEITKTTAYIMMMLIADMRKHIEKYSFLSSSFWDFNTNLKTASAICKVTNGIARLEMVVTKLKKPYSSGAIFPVTKRIRSKLIICVNALPTKYTTDPFNNFFVEVSIKLPFLNNYLYQPSFSISALLQTPFS